MRREGSALQGLGVVFLKELNDHLTSARMLVLQLLVLAVPLVSLYSAIYQLKQSTAEDPFLYLRVLTVAGDQLIGQCPRVVLCPWWNLRERHVSGFLHDFREALVGHRVAVDPEPVN